MSIVTKGSNITNSCGKKYSKTKLWKNTILNGNIAATYIEHKRKNTGTTIVVIIFLDFFMFYQIFLSPQVKQIVIISNKHGTYELPHELQNSLRLRNLRILGNWEILRRSQIFIEL